MTTDVRMTFSIGDSPALKIGTLLDDGPPLLIEGDDGKVHSVPPRCAVPLYQTTTGVPLYRGQMVAYEVEVDGLRPVRRQGVITAIPRRGPYIDIRRPDGKLALVKVGEITEILDLPDRSDLAAIESWLDA